MLLALLVARLNDCVIVIVEALPYQRPMRCETIGKGLADTHALTVAKNLRVNCLTAIIGIEITHASKTQSKEAKLTRQSTKANKLVSRRGSTYDITKQPLSTCLREYTKLPKSSPDPRMHWSGWMMT